MLKGTLLVHPSIQNIAISLHFNIVWPRCTWMCKSWHAINQIKLYCDFMPWLIEFETYGNAMLSGVTNSQHNIMVHVWIISIEVFCAINSYRHIKAIFTFTRSRLITSTHRGRDKMATTLRVIFKFMFFSENLLYCGCKHTEVCSLAPNW